MAYTYLCKVKENISIKQLQDWHHNNHEKRLSGRYITAQMIAPLLQEWEQVCSVKRIGNSVENRPIHALQIGSGKTRVLMWSQMHGNESTTTKAVFDVLIALKNTTRVTSLDTLLQDLTLCIVPILNPDGAHLYTRNNANDVDLNRDAQELTQPETIVLMELFDSFKPDICFNLHGQRTIYGFKDTGKPSVLSFLSPSADEARSITLSRKRSMSIISSINKALQEVLPGQIGRYDDGFNLNCVGDTFQNKEVPTVLFEAGHAIDDYEREVSREYVFLSLMTALKSVQDNKELETAHYFEITEHQKCYCDILIKNTKGQDIGIMYRECLYKKKVVFKPTLADNEMTKSMFGHREIDANGGEVTLIYDGKEGESDSILKISLENVITITL